MSNKRSIAWHEQCLANQGNSLKRLQNNLMRMVEDIERQERKYLFYLDQINTAKREGKDGFDQDKYLVKRRKS